MKGPYVNAAELRWRQQCPPKCWYVTAAPHGVIAHKTTTSVIAVNTWNSTAWRFVRLYRNALYHLQP